MKPFFTLLFLLVLSLHAQGEKTYDFSTNVRKAYDYTFSLRLTEAESILNQEKRDHPDNLAIYFVEDYIDFFKIFISEDRQLFDQLLERKEERLQLIRQGDKKSPYFLYMQAEIRLHWALLHLKFEENFKAALAIRKAYKQLETNESSFPDFVANKKSLGILHALIETIPDKYKKLAKFVGMSGTIAQGIEEMQAVIRYAKGKDFLFEEETLVMYAFLMLYVGNESDEAWTVMKNANLDTKNNPLACFAMANLSMNIGRNDEAIQLLENKPVGDQFLEFHYLDYMLGMAKLYRLDEGADIYLKRYAEEFSGQNYIKEAYQKLAWYALLFENEAQYFAYLGEARQKGATIVDEDRKAEREARYGPMPNKILLRARLLFDGGYYKKAEQTLLVKTVSDFEAERDKVEYYYRFGRIYHEMGKTTEALDYYRLTLELGAGKPYYFVANAALQSGLVYEDAGEYGKALKQFEACLKMEPEEYKDSLRQKAKAGKNRVKNR